MGTVDAGIKLLNQFIGSAGPIPEIEYLNVNFKNVYLIKYVPN